MRWKKTDRQERDHCVLTVFTSAGRKDIMEFGQYVQIIERKAGEKPEGRKSAENETGLCGYFLSSQKRPKDAGGRGHDGAGSGGEKRKGSLCRHFQL